MANEKRLIDANAFLSAMIRRFHCVPLIGRNDYDCDSLKQMLIEAPTVDAVEVVHGRWEPRRGFPGFVRCSVCHDCNIYDDWADGKKWSYCPHCGTKMDLEETADGKDV